MKFLKTLTAQKPVVYWAAILGVAVIGLVLLFSRNGDGEAQVLVVAPGEFVQEVSVSGKVVAAQEVDLAFSETGRVASIGVEVGDKVFAGQTLASLAIDILASDLRAAEIDLAEAHKEQGALVASAYRTLLSDDLAAVPASSYGVTVPVVTGLYEGSEGTYKLRVTRKENSTDYELRTLGLQDIEPIEILDDEPTALGTRGLFIDFPDALSFYNDTIWYVEIPNTKSASYLQNYNAYLEAQRARDKTIANAEAEVANIRADVGQRVVRAPFAGIVTAIPAEVGGIVSANEIALSLISDDTLQIESFVPEINISLLSVGSNAIVTLDAYGSGVPFEAKVVSVDPAETVRDGVSTYRAILQFIEQDPRVRSGMTANITITADRRAGVISVPQGILINRDGKKFVRVIENGETREREVAIGSVSSLGNIEIVSGLVPGEVVVLSD